MSTQDPPPWNSPGQQPPSGDPNQPSYGSQPPSYGSQPPSYGSQPPSYGSQQPSQGSDPYGSTPPSSPPGSYSQPYSGDQGQGGYGGYGGYGQQAPRNGLGTTALILGIVALLLCWIPVFGLLFGLIGLVAIILGIVGLRRVKRHEATNRGAALTGIILGAVALVVSIVVTVLAVSAVAPIIGECADPNLSQAQVEQCLNEQLGVTTAP